MHISEVRTFHMSLKFRMVNIVTKTPKILASGRILPLYKLPFVTFPKRAVLKDKKTEAESGKDRNESQSKSVGICWKASLQSDILKKIKAANGRNKSDSTSIKRRFLG